ncbi:MAG TPA: sigma-70 family RNA polymerase sigma factor [Chitinophagaceae bacterium]|nr:sigma-70 family RNA polymerase sigma factor [Chitinophagaceae bacterium]
MEPGTKYSEQELVVLLTEQSNDAFNYLYENYSGALYTIINQIVPDKDTASDVMQDVFVNIWKKMNSYDPSKGRLFTWMLNIARNAAIDKVRSKGYRDNLKNQPIVESANSGSAMTSNPMVNDVGLKKILTRLNNENRKLIELSYFQGFTHEEIAKMLGIPLGTVKTRIRSALSQLRIMMR